ncbi:hypothetical protein [Paenibacillus campi]|uniref:hypothetical protein n=1 Tax=Paenibacillus campi TaxID=3106031 RepID=UPI002AFE8337|nr:hypothetical protein [Paenibacillus sp. SGZ-1009]
MRKYPYRFKTISKVVLSPRNQHAFYADAGDFTQPQLKPFFSDSKDHDAIHRTNIIYPFYQYGDYASFDPKRTFYYVPGSSIKGVVLSLIQQSMRPKMLVDDINVHYENIKLNTLYKLQNTSKLTDEKVVLEPFFPNVAIEMIEQGCELQSEIICAGEIEGYLHSAQTDTMKKLEQFIVKLDSAIEQVAEDKIELNEQLACLRSNTLEIFHSIREERKGIYTLLLGGFKGLALSGVFSNADFSDTDSAIYIDTATYLPYGIIEITLLVEKL